MKQAVRVVVDVTQQRIAGVLRVIGVQTRVEADQIIQRVGVVQIVVILVPDVLELGSIKTAGQPRQTAPGDTGPVQVPAFVTVGQAAVGRADSGVSALVVRLGETCLATFNHPAVETVVGQADAAKGLGQHAGFAAGDHRVGEKQVTGLQFGIEGTHFQRNARRRERARRFTVAIADRQDARIISAATAVELEPEHGVGINAETDGALGVARFEEA